MTDSYEFSKSVFPQGMANETPYSSLQWNYINDINGGVYSGSGLSLCQFDLSSIYNSSVLVDPSKMYITVPITLVSAYTSNNTVPVLVDPTSATSAFATAGLKCGYWNMVHGADLIVAGKTIEQYQPNINTYINFKMLSSMSQDDMKSYGTSLGMGEVLDNPQSIKFATTVNQTVGTLLAYPGTTVSTLGNGLVGGNGITNNIPFGLANPNDGDQTAIGIQGTGCYNNGFYSRIKKYSDVTYGSYTSLFGSTATTGALATTIMTEQQCANEFKPYFKIVGASGSQYMVTYDVAVIRMCDLFDSMKSMCLMKKWDGIVRLYFNTGTVGSALTTGGKMITSGSSTTFTNTCPILQSALLTIPAVTGVVSGLFIGKATSTNVFGINLANSGASHAMTSCRMYYPQVALKPEKLIPYISENRAKKICFTSVLFNAFNSISSSATFSALVQSGVTGIRGILIVPFISGTINGTVLSTVATGITTFAQIQSPFDTAPATSAPISLTNLQVSVGGVNQLSNVLNYTYENFLEQVSLYEKINGADMGLSCGLVNQQYWDTSRSYYVDLSRGSISDNLSPRNVNITFNNNSNVTIDVMVFTEYFKEMIVDVETGLVSGL